MQYFSKILFTVLILFFSGDVSGRSSKEAYIDFISQVTQKWFSDEAHYNTGYFIDRPALLDVEPIIFRTDTLYDIVKIPPNFTKEDSITILGQLKKYRKHPYPLKTIPHVKLISSSYIRRAFRKNKDGWAIIHKKIGKDNGYRSISVPIFYDNGNKAIWQHGYGCGYLCGSGSISIYHKINGKWVWKDSVLDWVS